MHEIIIDASLVIKWFSQDKERYLSESLVILRKIKSGKIKAYAPAFLLIEIANILFKKKHLLPSRINEILRELIKSNIIFVEYSVNEVRIIVDFMSRYNITSYDALYLLAAKQKKCKLLTFDNQLLKIKSLTVGVKESLN